MYEKIHFKTIDSTNTYALSDIENLADKTVVTADIQTNGRGRFDRTWVSENDENLYFSIVLKPENTKHIINLTQYMSVVLTRVLEKYNVNAQIKWPNDVLVNDKKIAGILCESQNKGFVLGIGVNLNMTEEELKSIPALAASLFFEINKKTDKNEFLDKILNEFFKGYDDLLENGFSLFKDEYEKKSNFLNKKILITHNNKTEEFYADFINDDGSLTVIDLKGNERKIYAGDISL